MAKVSQYAFYGCKSLKDVYFDYGVQSIEKSAFANCTALENVEFASSISKIGEGAFYQCTNLQKIVLPVALTKLESDTFANCPKLSEIYIDKNVSQISSSFFGYSSKESAKIEVSKENPYYEVNGSCLIDVRDKSVVKGKYLADIPNDGSVTTIGVGAFFGNREEILIIPDFITTIKAMAFERSTATEVVIPESVTEIESCAFMMCLSLNKIQFPNGEIEIGTRAFAHCASLKEVVLPLQLTVIPESMFADCSSLEKVVLPSGVTEIGDYAFSGCKNLKQLEGLHETVVKQIGNRTFENCEALTELIFPQTLKTIGESAFYGCVALSHVYIPNLVSNIQYGAFHGCANLSNVEVQDGNELYMGTGGTLIRKKMRSLVYAHASAVIPGDRVVLSFGQSSFHCTGLEQVTIPATVQRFDQNAFLACDNLKTIIFLGTIQEWNKIEKDVNWYGDMDYKNVTVQCTDGTVGVLDEN